MPLLPNSPAIGHGASGNGTRTDRRGFVVPSGGSVDIGAFQSQPDERHPGDPHRRPGCALGKMSLREAVNLANALPGAHTINFDQNLFNTPQTISLTNGTLTLVNTSGQQTIDALPSGVTLRGDGADRVFLVQSGVNASLSGLQIINGRATGDGGGVLAQGTARLKMTDCTLEFDIADVNGGGFANEGTAQTTLINCTLTDDFAISTGGGVFNSGSLIVEDGTLYSNGAVSGGSNLVNQGGTTTLTNTIVAFVTLGPDVSPRQHCGHGIEFKRL